MEIPESVPEPTVLGKPVRLLEDSRLEAAAALKDEMAAEAIAQAFATVRQALDGVAGAVGIAEVLRYERQRRGAAPTAGPALSHDVGVDALNAALSAALDERNHARAQIELLQARLEGNLKGEAVRLLRMVAASIKLRSVVTVDDEYYNRELGLSQEQLIAIEEWYESAGEAKPRDEHTRFEAWVKNTGAGDPTDLNRLDNGYSHPWTQFMWRGWQARSEDE